AVKTATDVIVRTNSSGAIIDSVWQLLSQFVLGAQETVPDLIPQSLAVFGLVYPEQYLSQIAANTGSSNSVAATAFVTAFRVILSDKTVDARFDAHVKSALPKVLENLGHKDIDIRRLTLLLLYSVAQNKPSQLISLVKGFEPALYKQTEVDESLIRIITMGPFKKRIDDGLDARRVAFQCVYMLVRNIPDEITPSETAVVVARGIDDEADILGTTRLIVKELLVLSPSSLLSRLESVAEAVTKLASKKLTGTALRQEVESLRENVVSSFVIFVSLERLAKKSSSLMAKAMAKDGAYEKLRAVIANGSDDKIVATYDNANEILNRSE
ncbi:Cullin-associated NEDD8-dissociated protein 2, partial [Linderina macrospora]